MEAMAPPSRGGTNEGDNRTQSEMNRRKEGAKNRNRSPCAPCQNRKQKCERGTPCPRCLERGEPCLPGRKGRRNTFTKFIDETSQYPSEVPRGRPRRRATGPTSRETRRAASTGIGTTSALPMSPQSQSSFGGDVCAEPEDMNGMSANVSRAEGAKSPELDHRTASITGSCRLYPQANDSDVPPTRKRHSEYGLRCNAEPSLDQRDQHVNRPSHTELFLPHRNQTLNVQGGSVHLAGFETDYRDPSQITDNAFTYGNVLDQNNLLDFCLWFLQQHLAQQSHTGTQADVSMDLRNVALGTPDAMNFVRTSAHTIEERSSESQSRAFNVANDASLNNRAVWSEYTPNAAIYRVQGNVQEAALGGTAVAHTRYTFSPETTHTEGQALLTELASEPARVSIDMLASAPAGFNSVDQAIVLTSPTGEHSNMRQPDATAPNGLGIITDWDKFWAELNSAELNSPR